MYRCGTPAALPIPEFGFGQAVAWRPDPVAVEQIDLAAFRRRRELGSFEPLLRWAVEDVGWFRGAALAPLGVAFYVPHSQVMGASEGTRRPRWCVCGRMNVAHNLPAEHSAVR